MASIRGQNLRSIVLGVLGVTLLAASGMLGSCGQRATSPPFSRLVVGLVSDAADPQSLEKYQRFQTYLAEQLQTQVELEPVFNELRAVEQIRNGQWSLVFASPGLAAIAIDEAQYVPLFALTDMPNQRSLLLVQDESPYASLKDLTNQPVALGEPGSALAYYLPLYDLYGLTLERIRFAPTPKIVLEWLQEGSVAAGAIAEVDFQTYRREFSDPPLRVLNRSRVIPPGAVLLGPSIERNQQRQLTAAMQAAPAAIASDAGYVTNAPAPDFSQLIQLVKKVRPLESQLQTSPVVLILEDGSPATD